MKYCYALYRSSPNLNTRRSSIELLRFIADRRALQWVPEFLSDDDPTIQNWGAALVDQLVFRSEIGISFTTSDRKAVSVNEMTPDHRELTMEAADQACAELLTLMKDHPTEVVRRYYDGIQQSLAQEFH